MMRYLLALFLLLPACTTSRADAPTRAEAGDDVGALSCQCTAGYYTIGCPTNEFDGDFDCVCDGDDNCDGTPNCDRANADGDAFGDACDEFPNTPDPEALCASQDTRLDALEAANPAADVAALQADVALLTAALAEIRSKYPEHFHGLLGLNGEPVGDGGDLTYSLPGD
jgi:hypothetical protein